MLIDKLNAFPYLNANYSQISKPDTHFNDILSDKICNQTDVSQSIISNNFCNMNIMFKVGECNVSTKDWEKDNFPFWKYFDKNTKVEETNNWNKNSKVSEKDIQNQLQKIGYGEMVIIIPENIKQKMEEDSSFAEQIYKKIVTWKDEYDTMDNAIAAGNGLNTSVYQFSKSYCISLDENGEIDNYTVVSGGLDDSYSGGSQIVGKSDDMNMSFQRNTKMSGKELFGNSRLTLSESEKTELDYLESMSILASGFQKR